MGKAMAAINFTTVWAQRTHRWLHWVLDKDSFLAWGMCILIDGNTLLQEFCCQASLSYLGAIKDSEKAGLRATESGDRQTATTLYLFYLSHQAQTQFKTEDASGFLFLQSHRNRLSFSRGGKPAALFEKNESKNLGQ